MMTTGMAFGSPFPNNNPFMNGLISPPRYHGLNEPFGYQMKETLDRSISKHLEKGMVNNVANKKL